MTQLKEVTSFWLLFVLAVSWQRLSSELAETKQLTSSFKKNTTSTQLVKDCLAKNFFLSLFYSYLF